MYVGSMGFILACLSSLMCTVCVCVQPAVVPMSILRCCESCVNVAFGEYFKHRCPLLVFYCNTAVHMFISCYVNYQLLLFFH